MHYIIASGYNYKVFKINKVHFCAVCNESKKTIDEFIIVCSIKDFLPRVIFINIPRQFKIYGSVAGETSPGLNNPNVVSCF